MLELTVECERTSGEVFPVRFGWPHAMRDVVEIDDWWPGDDHCYYRVRASDGCRYILRHQEPKDVWELVVYESEAQQLAVPAAHALRRDALIH